MRSRLWLKFCMRPGCVVECIRLRVKDTEFYGFRQSLFEIFVGFRVAQPNLRGCSSPRTRTAPRFGRAASFRCAGAPLFAVTPLADHFARSCVHKPLRFFPNAFIRLDHRLAKIIKQMITLTHFESGGAGIYLKVYRTRIESIRFLR